MNKEKRKNERWEVSIPCTVTHMGETTSGKITNLSLGGAFITELTGLIPLEGTIITVHCQVENQEIKIKASVDASVARSLSNIRSDEIVGSIGAKFLDHPPMGQSWHDFIMLLITAY